MYTLVTLCAIDVIERRFAVPVSDRAASVDSPGEQLPEGHGEIVTEEDSGMVAATNDTWAGRSKLGIFIVREILARR